MTFEQFENLTEQEINEMTQEDVNLHLWGSSASCTKKYNKLCATRERLLVDKQRKEDESNG